MHNRGADQILGHCSYSQRARAQPYQDLIDRPFYDMAGQDDHDAKAFESRLEIML
jgi:hypothetical protein